MRTTQEILAEKHGEIFNHNTFTEVMLKDHAAFTEEVATGFMEWEETAECAIAAGAADGNNG